MPVSAETINSIQLLLGEGADAVQIAAITDLLEVQLLAAVQRYAGASIVDVPQPLTYILIEGVIARYNRLGSEGLTSESTDGYTASYSSTGWLADYAADIERWAVAQGFGQPSGAKVKFL